MTDTELAVIRAAVDLVHHWHTTNRYSNPINGPRLGDLEDALADAVHEYGHDGVHNRHEQ